MCNRAGGGRAGCPPTPTPAPDLSNLVREHGDATLINVVIPGLPSTRPRRARPRDGDARPVRATARSTWPRTTSRRAASPSPRRSVRRGPMGSGRSNRVTVPPRVSPSLIRLVGGGGRVTRDRAARWLARPPAVPAVPGPAPRLLAAQRLTRRRHPQPAARPEPPMPPPADHLAPDELIEGTDHAFGVTLPRGLADGTRGSRTRSRAGR